MQVQTYLINTNEEVQEAEDQERQELIQKLEIIDEESSVSAPFKEMSQGEYRCYVQVLPFSTKWKEYRGFIPTPALRLIEQFRDQFTEIYILSDNQNDPILYGKIKESMFLMAKWGNMIEPFESVKTRAKEIWKLKYKAECLEKIEVIKSKISEEGIANQWERHFKGEWVYA